MSLGEALPHPMGSLLAASLRRIGGRFGVLAVAVCAVGPLALGDLLPKPAVRRRWCAAVVRRFVPRGGARSGANASYRVRHALRATKVSRGARSWVHHITRHIRP